jgi:hypothetical protein
MNGYETVFTIPRYGPHILAAALGIAGLVPGIAGVVSFILTHRRFPKRIFWPVSLIIIGGFAMTFAVIGFRIKSDLLSRYDSEEWTVLEGTVHVLREQPYGGHAPGDLIEIDGMQIEINKFESNMQAYSQTIAHGGHLTEGAQARVFLLDGLIVRVDVKRNGTHNNSVEDIGANRAESSR